ncbi:hypothetical protein AAHE18_01G047300 [Arachis hypogaea]
MVVRAQDSEVILYPQAIFKDPFRRGENILISLRRADASMWLMLINKLSKKSLLPVLFSTETFAMGVNAPARTSWKEDV